MADTFVLQDWVTVRMPSTSRTIAQSPMRWLDLATYRDVMVYVQTRNVSSATLNINTGPDFIAFGQLATQVLASNSVYRLNGRYATASTPLARYLSWEISSAVGVSANATFRILVAATRQLTVGRFRASFSNPRLDGMQVMQDWSTFSITTAPLVQPEPLWLDLEAFSSVEFVVQTAEAGVAVQLLEFQTSPTADNDLFLTMTDLELAPNSVTRLVVRYESAAIPLARFVRWRLVAAATSAATFRILYRATSSGAPLKP